MVRINNKVKKSLSRDPYASHPGRFLKQDTNSRLRKKARRDIQTDDLHVVAGHSKHDKYAIRKQAGHCPVCMAKLRKNNRGTRYLYCCGKCKAQLKPVIRCPRCDTNRVWVHGSKMRCKGCGNEVRGVKVALDDA
jgi:hypothetical protein